MSAANANHTRHLAIDELDRKIVGLAAYINAATYDLLVLIREFDERAGWLKWGLASCAEWLHWRCDLSMSAAREKVRVAHALKTLPDIAAAFAGGRLSYTKVRALTRVARADNEADLLTFAEKTTAAHVDERCRELRCGTAVSVSEANRAHGNRSLRVYRDPSRGTMMITVELPLETGALVEKALDHARDTAADEAPGPTDESWSARQADALVAMVRAYMSGRTASSGSAENYQVMVHVDHSALANGQGRAGLPIESVKRLCCDGELVAVVKDEHGEPLSIGRKSRAVPTAIRRALKARDRGCVFPGCGNTRFVDAHHVEHWSAGGETSLDNLVLLCSRHHRLVHEGGFRIERDYQNRWFFKRPDGRAVPACGYRPEDTIDDDTSLEIDHDIGNLSATIRNPSAEGLAGAGRTAANA